MTTQATLSALPAVRSAPRFLLSQQRFDWIAIGLSMWLVGGLFLDGWAHNHGKVDDSFFTPWHALFYSGFAAVALFLLFTAWRNWRQGANWRTSVPAGYALSLIGVAIFAVGGVGDLIWHTLFGIEESTEALLSPTHLLLIAGIALIVTGPLRAASAYSPADLLRWSAAGPLLLSATLFLASLSFITQFTHPQVEPLATMPSEVHFQPVREIYRMNADGSGQTRLTASPLLSAEAAAWSPDQQWIVYAAGPIAPHEHDGAPHIDLHLMRADGRAAQLLVERPGLELWPTWSPDGQRILFVDPAEGNSQIYIIARDGSQLQQLTTVGSNSWPTWSPDGTRIAFQHEENGASAIYMMDAAGSNPTRLTPGDGRRPAWSPDGKRLAYSVLTGDQMHIYVMNADGSNPLQLTHNAFDNTATWSADCQRLAFQRNQDEKLDIFAINLDGTNLTNLTNGHALNSFWPRWSPDGEQIVYTSEGRSGTSIFDASVRLGISSILLQAALLTGVLLVLFQRPRLPFGALTLVLGLNSLLIATQDDTYLLVIPALVTGLLLDWLLLRWPAGSGQPTRQHLWACAAPALFYACYFVGLYATSSVGWSIHVWSGAIVLAGVVGLLLSLLRRALIPLHDAPAG